MQTNFGVATLVMGILILCKIGQIYLMNHGQSMGSKSRIGSKVLCKERLMLNACEPILMGKATSVLEILLPFACLQIWPNFPFMGIKNRIGSKISCKYRLM